MKIPGTENMTPDEITFEVQRGGKFVRYLYCISVFIITYKEPKIYFIKAGESRLPKALAFALLSLVAGWWGIPWGPIYTIEALVCDLRGGEDITAEIWAGPVVNA